MRLILCFVLAALGGSATNYTVKAGGGGNFTTMSACATQMSMNGSGVSDTCTVFAGDYTANGVITVPAGSVGNYKIFNVNGSDVVNVQGFILNSHTKVIGNCPTSVAPATTNVCGFSIANTASPKANACVDTTGNITDFYITSNVLYACANGTGGGMIHIVGGTFGYIQGNTLSYSGTTKAVADTWACNGTNPLEANGINWFPGNHGLIENNDMSHYTLGIDINASFLVVRNNIFHDQHETEAGGNCHTDSWFSEPGPSPGGSVSTFNVYEGNIDKNGIGPNAKMILAQNDSNPPSACWTGSPTTGNCFGLIERYNIGSNLGGGINSPSEVNTWPEIKFYNNTIVDGDITVGGGGGIMNNLDAQTNAAQLNSIYASSPWQISGNTIYSCGANCNRGFNIFHCYGSCGSTVFPGDTGNQNVDPLFINYSGIGNASNNYHLQGTSPALGAGTNLTTVSSGCGSGVTSITLADSWYFQDGYGLVGVQPDTLRVGGAGAPVPQISAGGITYATGVVNLASAINCSNGDKVYLYKRSDGSVVLPQGQANPDLGALPNISSVMLSNSPTSIAFGNVQSGQTGTVTAVTVSNIGSANAASIACSITGTNANQFSLSGSCPGTLAFGANFTQTVNCAPTGAGSFNANLTINDSSDGVSSSTTLSCTGTTQAPNLVNAPTSIAFGNQSTGTSSSSQAVTITNNGTGLATISSCALTGTDANQFTLTGTCVGTLAINANFTQNVSFSPTTVGAKSASLTITYDSGANSVTTLTGTGVNLSAITKVHVTACGPGTAASPSTALACTIPSTGSGNAIIVGIASPINLAPASYTVTDNQSNTYLEAAGSRSVDANTGASSDIYYCVTCTGAVTSVSIIPSSGSGQFAMVVWEDTVVNALDKTAALNSQAASATPLGAPVSISASAEVVVSIASVQGGVTGINAGNVCTNDATVFGNGWASDITNATGTIQCQWMSSSGTYSSSTASFMKASASVNTPNGISILGPVVNSNSIQHQ